MYIFTHIKFCEFVFKNIMGILESPKNQPKGIQVIEEYTKEGKLSRQGRIKLVQLTVSDGLVQAHGTQ